MPSSKILFALVCIPVRVCIAYLGYYLKSGSLGLKLFGAGLLVPAAGFLALYFGNLRMTAPEATGGKTWWAPLRLIHGMLYLTAAIYGIRQSRLTWVPLALDVLVGAAAGAWNATRPVGGG